MSPEGSARSPWKDNAWLLAAGLTLSLSLLALGPDAFVALVREIYTTRIAQFSPEFRVRLARETRALYAILVIAGIVFAAAWAGFSVARKDAVRWALGSRDAVDWRGVALLLVLLSSSLFLTLRGVRDFMRFDALRGLPFDEQRRRLAVESPIEPDYASAGAFVQGHGTRPGNVLVVRPATWKPAWHSRYIFLAAYLFPVRLYAGKDADLAPELLERRGIRWIQPENPATTFGPEPVESVVP